MIDLDGCRFVVWGFKNLTMPGAPGGYTYDTFMHIHEAFHRVIPTLGREALWLDDKDDLSALDLRNTFFISESRPALVGMPIRDDCFYAVHGLHDNAELRGRFVGRNNYVNWNLYNNLLLESGHYDGWRWLDEEVPFDLAGHTLGMRWATNLLPHEIEANKPAVVLRGASRIIHWIGTTWWVNDKELADFKRACDENGIEFRPVGAGQRGVVNFDDNIRLTRESYFAPAIVGTHHVAEGYVPCRLFKNISYGQYGVTNSAYANRLFGGKLVYNPDPYRLFYDARERLAAMPVDELYDLMDEVARKHTYLNRIGSLMKAARLIMGQEDKSEERRTVVGNVDLNNPVFVNTEVTRWSPQAEWKRALLVRLGRLFDLHVFVETGTCDGGTVEAVRHSFERVYSVELSPEYHSMSVKRFAGAPNVHLILGDSAEELEKLLRETPCAPTLFWLDAHLTGGEFSADAGDPIPAELAAIFRHRPDSLIVIDDVAPDFLSWPSLSFLAAQTEWRYQFRAGVLALHRGQYMIPEIL